MRIFYLSTRLLQLAICLLVASILANGAQPVFAHSSGDIALFATANQADLGFAVLDENDEQQLFLDPDVNTFSSVLIPLPPNPLFAAEWISQEPGFHANVGTLPGNAAVEVSTLALSYWNGGGGAVDFSPAVGVRGFYQLFANTRADGGLLDNPAFGLDDLTADGQPIPTGVYLGKMQLSVAGLDDSDPFYLIGLVDNAIGDAVNRVAASEELGAMVIAYLTDPLGAPEPEYGGKNFIFFVDAVNYAQAIPEPGTATLCLAALLGMAGIRRRGFLKNLGILGVIVVALAVAWLPSQRAAAHGNGILAQVLEEKIVIGFENDIFSGQPILGVQAFPSVLTANDAAQDPSFVSYAESNIVPPPAGSLPLPAEEDLYWDFLPMTIAGVTSNLFYWEGLGTTPEEVDFVANPHPDVTMGYYNLDQGVWSTIDGAGQMVPGELIGTTDVLGNDLRLHNHLNWYALDDGDSSADTHPPDGIYLFAMQLRMAGLTTSDPFYIASATLGTPLTALQNAAMPWIEEHADTLILAGDYNFSGVVDGMDFLAWQRQVGSSGPFPIDGVYADGDLDGVVGAGDVTVWQENFAVGGVTQVGRIAGVPEPGSVRLLVCAVLVAIGTSGVLRRWF